MVAYDLQDGTHIPPGSKVALDMKAIHFNPQIYPHPDWCDLFRFSKLREKESTDIKYGFGTVDSNVCRPFSSYPGDQDIFRAISYLLSSTFYLVPVRQTQKL